MKNVDYDIEFLPLDEEINEVEQELLGEMVLTNKEFSYETSFY